MSLLNVVWYRAHSACRLGVSGRRWILVSLSAIGCLAAALVLSGHDTKAWESGARVILRESAVAGRNGPSGTGIGDSFDKRGVQKIGARRQSDAQADAQTSSVRHQDGDGQCCRMTLGATEVSRVPAQSFAGWVPFTPVVKWRPGRNELLVERGDEVYLVEADGSWIRRLIGIGVDRPGRERSEISNPSVYFDVSPDGAYITYSTLEYPDPPQEAEDRRHGPQGSGAEHPSGFHHEIVRMHIDSGRRERITSNDVHDFGPTWSPDGTRIAVIRSPWSDRPTVWHELLTIGPDGSDSQLLVSDSSLRSGVWSETAPRSWLPVWSPDGERIAITRTRTVDPGGDERRRADEAIHLVDVKTGSIMRLTGMSSVTTWSPDGRRLAFAKSDGEKDALYTIAADGSNLRRVTTIVNWLQPHREGPRATWIPHVAWSPDGSKILYTCGFAVCVVAVDGTAVGRTRIHMEGGAVPAWSPDGTRIAVFGRRPLEYSPVIRGTDVVLYTMAPDGGDIRILLLQDDRDEYRRAGTRRSEVPEHVGDCGTPAPHLDLCNPWEFLLTGPGCATGTAVPEPDVHPGLVEDCETLLELRDELAGAAKLNWSASRSIWDWEGVVLGGSPVRVQVLKLEDRGLSRVIPAAIGRLTHLRKLWLTVNHLGGVLPPELGNLRHLEALDIRWNYLSGELPREMGTLPKLRLLLMEHTFLGENIP